MTIVTLENLSSFLAHLDASRFASYYTKTESDTQFAPVSHTHTVSAITDLTATATEINYTAGVTSAIQTQLDAKLGVSDNAASATRLATARTITLAGAVTGSASFDGSGDITITTAQGTGSSVSLVRTTSTYTTEASGQASTAISNYVSGCILDVYVNGLRLLASEYSVDASGNFTCTLASEAGQEFEFVVTTVG